MTVGKVVTRSICRFSPDHFDQPSYGSERGRLDIRVQNFDLEPGLELQHEFDDADRVDDAGRHEIGEVVKTGGEPGLFLQERQNELSDIVMHRPLP